MRRALTTGTTALVAMLLASSVAQASIAPPGRSLALAGFGAVALDEAQHTVFVSGGSSSNSVVAVDTRSLTAQPTVVNDLPGATGLAVSADGTRLYVALTTGDAIAVLDATTRTEITRFATGPQTCPSSLARTGRFVWFSYGCSGGTGAAIGRLDPTRPPAKAVKLGLQGSAYFNRAPLLASSGVAGGPLVAAQPGTSPSSVAVYSVAAGALTTGPTADVSGGLTDVAVASDGATLFTASGSRDRAESFATADLAAMGTYGASPRPNSVALNPAGTFVAVGAATTDTNDVLIYRPGAAAPTTTQTLGPGDVVAPRGLAFAAANATLYVVTQHDGQPQPSLVAIPNATTF